MSDIIAAVSFLLHNLTQLDNCESRRNSFRTISTFSFSSCPGVAFIVQYA
jgi:hypothetical protein